MKHRLAPADYCRIYGHDTRWRTVDGEVPSENPDAETVLFCVHCHETLDVPRET